MAISYHKILDFPFYSLDQFTQLRPLSRSKSTIYLYQHNQSKQTMAVKEVNYNEQSLKVYQTILKRQSLEAIVKIRGICLMTITYNQVRRRNINRDIQENLDGIISQCELAKPTMKKTNSNEGRQTKSLLLFMEKCQCNMLEYIRERRNQKKPFRTQQISKFISETLFLLQILERDGVSHRDIKPENFLFDRGKFRICDFDDAIYISCPENKFKQEKQLDLTTLEFCSPEFYRNLKNPKTKLFDSYKLDVYAFGLTVLCMCSLGRFDILQRKQYLIQDSVYHSEFIKEQRRKFIKHNDSYKIFNTFVKIMLEQDEYKRDNFITLLIKIKPIFNVKGQISSKSQYQASQIGSDLSKAQENRLAHLGNKKNKSSSRKNSRWVGSTQLQKNSLISLLIFGFSFFVFLLIL